MRVASVGSTCRSCVQAGIVAETTPRDVPPQVTRIAQPEIVDTAMPAGRNDPSPASTRFRCAVCDGGSGEPLLHAQDYPGYLLPIPSAVAGGVLRADMSVWQCLACGHLQIPEPDPALLRTIFTDYYAHYQMDSVVAQVPLYREPFEAFVTAHAADLPRGTWLEVGCSNGERVPFFERFADRYVGMDPSSRIETARARHGRREFIRGAFPDAAGNLAFDVSVSQLVLQHIVEVGAFLDAAHARTRPGGALIAQVPDIGHYERRDQPNFLSHEHVHYFRGAQLDLVLRRHGWLPFAWGPTGPSLMVAARRAQPMPAPPPEPALRDWSRIRALFDAPFALPAGPVVFYGVGPLLFWMLARSHPSGPVDVIDDNPTYHDMAVPCFGWPIRRFDAQRVSAVGTVVLSLNPLYHDAVLRRLAAAGCAARVFAWTGSAWRETVVGAGAA